MARRNVRRTISRELDDLLNNESKRFGISRTATSKILAQIARETDLFESSQTKKKRIRKKKVRLEFNFPFAKNK